MRRASGWFKAWTWFEVATVVIGALLGTIVFFAAFAAMVLFGAPGFGGLL